MKPHTLRRIALAVVATTCLSSAGTAQTIFKDQDDTGTVVFSDLPSGTSRTAYRAPPDRPQEVAGASCTGIGSAALDDRAAVWRERVHAVAARHALEPALFEAMIRVESCFDPAAISRAGAQGLTQLMPATARELGVDDPFDAEQNLEGGARYLARMLARFGSETLALAAYNAGPGAVERHDGVPPFPETRSYLERIAALRLRP